MGRKGVKKKDPDQGVRGGTTAINHRQSISPCLFSVCVYVFWFFFESCAFALLHLVCMRIRTLASFSSF